MSRGAGTAGEWKRDRRNVEQGPACGMRPWSRSEARRSNADPMRVSGVRSPEGRLTRWSRGPNCVWGCDPSQTQRIAAHDRLRGQIPGKHRGPSSALRRSSSAPRRAPFAGMRPARRSAEQGPRFRGCDRAGAHRHADRSRRAWPASGSHLRPTGAGTAPPSAGHDACRRRECMGVTMAPEEAAK